MEEKEFKNEYLMVKGIKVALIKAENAEVIQEIIHKYNTYDDLVQTLEDCRSALMRSEHWVSVIDKALEKARG